MSAGSNLGRVYRIGRSKAFGAWAAAQVTGARRRAAAEPPEFAHPALRGSIRPELGSVGIHVACASHWRRKHGSAGLGRGSPRRGAEGAVAHRRRAASQALKRSTGQAI